MENKKAIGLYQDKTRITIFLPTNNSKERMAVDNAINSICNLYNGSTQSLVRPVSFKGWWWSDKLNSFIEDKIVVLIVDAPYAIDSDEIDIDVELIKLEIQDFYRRATGSKQKELWIIAHQAWRVI